MQYSACLRHGNPAECLVYCAFAGGKSEKLVLHSAVYFTMPIFSLSLWSRTRTVGVSFFFFAAIVHYTMSVFFRAKRVNPCLAPGRWRVSSALEYFFSLSMCSIVHIYSTTIAYVTSRDGWNLPSQPRRKCEARRWRGRMRKISFAASKYCFFVASLEKYSVFCVVPIGMCLFSWQLLGLWAIMWSFFFHCDSAV